MGLGEGGQHIRQPQPGRGLHAADRQRPARRAVILRRPLGLADQIGDLHREGPQALARRGQGHAAAVPVEQGDAELLLQLAQPGGDVRLHGVQLRRRTADAAGARHRFEDPQILVVHDAPPPPTGMYPSCIPDVSAR